MSAYVSPREFQAAARQRPTVTGATSRRPGGVLAWISGLVQRVLEQPRRRAVIAELAQLSDHELTDIGLSRGNLHRVFDRDLAVARAR
jgi:uncharacterized protein YjiS (DUF1127 family)